MTFWVCSLTNMDKTIVYCTKIPHRYPSNVLLSSSRSRGSGYVTGSTSRQGNLFRSYSWSGHCFKSGSETKNFYRASDSRVVGFYIPTVCSKSGCSDRHSVSRSYPLHN